MYQHPSPHGTVFQTAQEVNGGPAQFWLDRVNRLAAYLWYTAQMDADMPSGALQGVTSRLVSVPDSRMR